MSRQFASPFRLALLAVLALAPLRAQLDTRLLMSTDSMDVYKNPTTVKPEILTLIDMTGSTAAVTWHPNYHPASSVADTRTNIVSSDANATNYTTLTTSSGGTTFTLRRTAGGTQYSGVTLRLTKPVVGFASATRGSFVMPDGTPVEDWLLTHPDEFFDSTTGLLKIDSTTDTSPIRSNVTTINTNAILILSPNHRYFALKSTHARVTYNSQTVDLPIPWKIFDSPATATGDNASISDAEDPQDTATPKARVSFDTVDRRPPVSGGNFPNGATYPLSYNPDYYQNFIFADASPFVTSTARAWANGLPALNRLQAMKRAVIQTWLGVQTKVFWAVRAIDDNNDNSTLNSNPTGTAREVPRILLDRTSAGISWLQNEISDGTTPLTYALAGCYAQMVDGSVFASARSAETALNVCRKQFVIVFTDGIANDGYKLGDPFKDSTATTTNGVTTYSGITTVKTTPANLNSSNTYFNIWSLAGVAALGNDAGWTATKMSGTGTISDFAPFSVNSRDGGTAFSPHHSIETMTIGVSLTGTAGEADTPMNALLLTAGYGKSGQTSFDSANYVPWNSTPTGSQIKVRFWNAQNAGTLSDSITSAIRSTMDAPPTTTSPVAPAAGLKAGEQTYFATYKAEQNNAPLWSGDLMMVRTQVSGTTVTLKGLDGVDLSNTEILPGNAIWAASNVLKTTAGSTTWNGRKVYTYLGTLAGTDATANRYAGLDKALTAYPFTTTNDSLLAYMTGLPTPSATDKAAQIPKIEWMLGKGRTDGASILGDIINSTPVVIEYDAATYLAGTGLTVPDTGSGTRLRLIFVGTNHGFLHAFAEASYFEGTPSVLKAVATELWAFVPPEFAKGAYEQLTSGSDHVYMVDGPAAGYLDESSSTAGFVGKVDNANDKAMVIFGLGKGGRSVYALDVSAPTAPKLAWALRPDDEIGANANLTIAAMGMSAGIPDQARIRTTSAGPTYGFKDVLFIGGGLSTDTIDAKFGSGKKLGRSVLAVDTQTGALYKTWDFINNSTLKTSFPSMGSVAAGPMAMEVLSGTNLTQRVYFADRLGGVYALGCGKLQTAGGTNPGFRIDSSDPNEWVDNSSSLSVRTLFKANVGEYITTSPVPFRLPYGYPGAAISGKSSPQAVGVAVGTGDLWDPMDRDAANPAAIAATEYQRLVVLFDRNDSAAKSYDTSGITLTDLTTPGTKIDPTNSGYYLKNSDGYYIGFDRKAKPAGQAATETASGVSNFYYQKVISEPLVFRNVLYFTVLKPDVALTDGSCSGISKSDVFRIADVINPNWLSTIISGTSSGKLFTFAGIPGKLSVIGPNLVGLAGTMTVGKDGAVVNDGKGMITVGTDAQTLTGPSVRLRSWRIVR